MAILSGGTTSTTALKGLLFNPVQGVGQGSAASLLAPADLAGIAAAITDDNFFATSNPNGILATGTTHSNETLDTLVSTGGGPLSAIQTGFLVLGVGIVPGTFVTGFNNAGKTSVGLSQNASAGASGVRIAFIPPNQQNMKLSANGQLLIPNRGLLKVLPGDYVFIDNTGWPILLSGATAGYAGTQWNT